MSQYGEPYCTDKEAGERFKKYREEDPFPNIYPSLLNSADIDDYVKATGMICPYYSPRLLKSASYEAQIGDKAVYWNEKGEKCEVDLSDGKSVTIEPNSLIFLTTKQKFRLPDYIAIRFNLRITNVHRGLLLGTGPLVDPGFEGRLVIPLHNFTTNPYSFRVGERFIWIEFTKISPNSRWAKNQDDVEPRKGEYKKFRPPIDSDINHYLDEASPQLPIRSAIPEALTQARDHANQTEKRVDEFDQTLRNYKNIGAVATVIAGLSIAFALISNYNDFSDLAVNTTSIVTEVKSEILQSQATIRLVNQKLSALEKMQIEVDELSRQNQNLGDQIEAIQKRIDRGTPAPAEQN